MAEGPLGLAAGFILAHQALPVRATPSGPAGRRHRALLRSGIAGASLKRRRW